MAEIFFDHLAPIAAIGLVGWICARWDVFSRQDAQILNRYVFYIALPILMFDLLANAPKQDFQVKLAGVYLISEIILYALGFAIVFWGFRRSKMEALLIGMSFVYVNHVFFVLPVAMSAYGSTAVAPILSVITIDSIVLYAGTVLLLDLMSSRKVRIYSSLIGTLKNPNVIGILLGLFVTLTSSTLPSGISKFSGFVGASASPVALFSLGIILAQRRRTHIYALPLTIAAFKVIIHPFIVWCLFSLGLSWLVTEFNMVLLVAAGPCGLLPFVLALHYQVDEKSIALAILLSSLGSFLALAFII